MAFCHPQTEFKGVTFINLLLQFSFTNFIFQLNTGNAIFSGSTVDIEIPKILINFKTHRSERSQKQQKDILFQNTLSFRIPPPPPY